MSEQKPSDDPSAAPETEMVFRRLESPVRWVPPGIDFDELSEQEQAALRRIVGPAYEELVDHAADSVERLERL